MKERDMKERLECPHWCSKASPRNHCDAHWRGHNQSPLACQIRDGEICSLDKKGQPQFRNLLFHRGNYPCFLAFDLLMRNGKDCRRESLLDRKQELRRVLNGSDARIQYVD
jgi:ATP-dependent DNA ligase